MKIVQVGHNCCVRLQKQGLALSHKHDVHLLAHRIPRDISYYKTVSHWYTQDQLRNELLLHRDADIIHVHNEPNWPVFIVKETVKVPVILDIHDSMLLRSDRWEDQRTEERIAYEMADGIVYVNTFCRDEINLKNKPSICLPPYVNRRDIKYFSWDRIGGLVYEGLVQIDSDPKVMQYGNFLDLCKELKMCKIPFHIFSPKFEQDKYLDAYDPICFVEQPQPYQTLLKQLGMFDWGFCGNIHKYREWDITSPNKLFEYMAAGIPIIAMNCKWVEEFVKLHGVGISVSSCEEIRDRWDERAECQKNVMLKRNTFVMENYIHKLEDLYRRVIA